MYDTWLKLNFIKYGGNSVVHFINESFFMIRSKIDKLYKVIFRFIKRF